MDAEGILRACFFGERLKLLSRTGWHIVGVPNSLGESIASHTYGVSLFSVLLSDSMKKTDVSVDIAKVLIMAALHDLSESILSDIPVSSERFFGNEYRKLKDEAELNALLEILPKANNNLHSIFKEYTELSTLEARIVRASDILDMLTHAISLESNGFSAEKLDEFFVSGRRIIEKTRIELALEIYHLLNKKHKENLS